MDSFVFIDEIIKYIEQNLTEEIALENIAKRSGYTRWYFQRFFHSKTGETIGSYVRRRRLTCAAEELTQTSTKILDLALKYQFGSAEAFSRAFKSEYQMAPAAFRKKPPAILPNKKKRMDSKHVKILIDNIGLVPQIKLVETSYTVGAGAILPNPLSQRLQYLNDVEKLWKQFGPRIPDIENGIADIKVGFIDDLIFLKKPHIYDDSVYFAACISVSNPEALPKGLSVFCLPKGLYAIFSYRGYHEPTQYMIDYVYSTWLPKSNFERNDGPEWTCLDHRNQPLDPKNSEVLYYLPIRPCSL